jgi:hypothetical protein
MSIRDYGFNSAKGECRRAAAPKKDAMAARSHSDCPHCDTNKPPITAVSLRLRPELMFRVLDSRG